ncbi:hypothetical protein B0T17DRAFT_518038 [Bombardia bombarda]|uniref:Uncharacterized protein n=1 Tax=Bombardia bombarda TaxID=252184 RepID=A0AA39XL81_9PEZI|nr:hypothetical protein B0T17DRAFT_518038 [Bombardia bombarda]
MPSHTARAYSGMRGADWFHLASQSGKVGSWWLAALAMPAARRRAGKSGLITSFFPCSPSAFFLLFQPTSAIPSLTCSFVALYYQHSHSLIPSPTRLSLLQHHPIHQPASENEVHYHPHSCPARPRHGCSPSRGCSLHRGRFRFDRLREHHVQPGRPRPVPRCPQWNRNLQQLPRVGCSFFGCFGIITHLDCVVDALGKGDLQAMLE